MKNEKNNNKLFTAAVIASGLFIADITMNFINLYHTSKKIQILERCKKLGDKLESMMNKEKEEKQAAENEETKEEN